MKNLFEEYLESVHSADYHGTDDDMPDSFDAWISEKDGADMKELAESFADILVRKVKVEVLSHAGKNGEPSTKDIINKINFY